MDDRYNTDSSPPNGFFIPRCISNKSLAPAVHLPETRLPDPLIKIALKAMSLEPADRHATVRELQAEVSAFQLGEKKRPALFGVDGLFGARKKRDA